MDDVEKGVQPLLLGEQPDRQGQEYITELRHTGGVVNIPVVIATDMGILESHYANLLLCHINLLKD